MDYPAGAIGPGHHHGTLYQFTLPTLASLLRLLPLFLLFLLTTPHGVTEHIHASYMRRPYVKPSPRDLFPSQIADVDLSFLTMRLETETVVTNIVVSPSASLYAALRIPSSCTEISPCSALVEVWYDGDVSRELRPDPYLLAANGVIPQPFTRIPNAHHADDEAFFTWRPYHFLQLYPVTTGDNWHIRVFNYDSTVFNNLNATLRVTVSPALTDTSDNMTSVQKILKCPRGPAHDAPPCFGRGRCQKGKCLCDVGSGGRYCESDVEDIPRGEFDVPPDAMKVFRYVTPFHANVATELRLLPPQAVSAAAYPILFAKRPGANGGHHLTEGPPLPTIYDAAFTDAAAVRAHQLTQSVVTRNVRGKSVIYIAVYNFRAAYPAWLVRRHPKLRSAALLAPRRPVRVALRAYPCVYASKTRESLNMVGVHRDHSQLNSHESFNSQGLSLCPSRTSDLEHNMRILLGPLLLMSLTLLIMVVCVSVWVGVFRQPILDGAIAPGGIGGAGVNTPTLTDLHTDRRDKLSEAEVDAMFPAFRFAKRDAAALCAVGDSSCSVCLCPFEEGDSLRRLTCGHAYHAPCLARWLITSATCPRCRNTARISAEGVRVGAVRHAFRRTFLFFSSASARFRSIIRVAFAHVQDDRRSLSSEVALDASEADDSNP